LFSALPNKEGMREQARVSLQGRLAGKIDAATSYMKVSAYARKADLQQEVRGAVVIFLHDFYDSPHVYDELVFPDFWSWICFTIETLRAAGIPFFVKPHPNQIALSSKAIDDLRRAYPDLRLLPMETSNVQLADAGLLCGVTVYGTVAHELAFMGIPTIACARHPHHAFAFCRTARSRDEYADFLRDPGFMPLPAAEMRAQALEFYYMHNLFGEEPQLKLRESFVAAWKAFHDPAVPTAEAVQSYRDLRDCEALSDIFDTRARLDEGVSTMDRAPARRRDAP
jgi:hypothetical protein